MPVPPDELIYGPGEGVQEDGWTYQDARVAVQRLFVRRKVMDNYPLRETKDAMRLMYGVERVPDLQPEQLNSFILWCELS